MYILVLPSQPHTVHTALATIQPVPMTTAFLVQYAELQIYIIFCGFTAVLFKQPTSYIVQGSYEG
jgi:hypothetical protein